MCRFCDITRSEKGCEMRARSKDTGGQQGNNINQDVARLHNLLKYLGGTLMTMSTPVETPLSPGLRVLRGPSWTWDDQDGGQGHVGTVIAIGGHGASPKGTVIVQWDSGVSTNYRIGFQEAFDLRVFDNATIGVRHQGITCAHCGSADFFGIRWRCSRCPEIDLCSICYNSDRHETEHEFRRFDSPESKGTYIVSSRKTSTKISIKGIFPGAEVTRSKTWQWDDQDGGPGSVGRVITIDGWNQQTDRSIATVYWPASEKTFQYRVGNAGRVDLQYVRGQFGSGGFCYVDHLPIVGKVEPVNYSPKHCRDFSMKKFSLRDRVKINVDLETLQGLQEGHGGFSPKMEELIGKLGYVHRITASGDIRVQYPGKPEMEFRWTVHPAALKKVMTFQVGELVEIISSEEEVKALQIGHGGWIDTLRMALGQIGQVLKTYPDGDVRVKAVGQEWTLHPGCLKPHFNALLQPQATPAQVKSDSNSELIVHYAARGELAEVEQQLQGQVQVDDVLRALQTSSRLGHLPIVNAILNYMSNADINPDQVVKGKTALHLAIYEGHLDIVDLLMTSGAKLDTPDVEGDRALHYSVYGKKSTVMEFLLERGADVNIRNERGFSALHLAIHNNDEECVRVLFKYKIDVNIQSSSSGETALHRAVATKAKDSITELLLEEKDLDLTLTNANGFNFLHMAAMKGNEKVAKICLEKHPELADAKKGDGCTPLHLASLNGSIEVTRLLLHQGQSKPNVTDKLGKTPLHHACAMGFYKIAELLLHNGPGADPNIKDSDRGHTPLHVLLSKQDTAIRILAEDHPAGHIDPAILTKVKNAGVASPMCRWVSMALLLVINGADLKMKDRKGATPFDGIKDPSARSLLLEQSLACSEGDISAKPVEEVKIECRVCSEKCIPVLFKPCDHKIACVTCSARMKKCIHCKVVLTEKILPEADPDSGAAKNTMRVSDLEAKVRELEDQYLCSICMERRKTVVFMCGHGACSDCVETLRLCHMCRGPIIKKINLY